MLNDWMCHQIVVFIYNMDLENGEFLVHANFKLNLTLLYQTREIKKCKHNI